MILHYFTAADLSNPLSHARGVHRSICRLSYDELVKEVGKWKDEVEETRNEMKEGGELPSDLQKQMDEFLPVG